MPKKNIGTPDRIVRLLIALALFTYAYYDSSWIAFLAGLFTLFEAFMSWCILYQLLGINRCPLPKKPK